MVKDILIYDIANKKSIKKISKNYQCLNLFIIK
jgi:hypothetical protein